MMVNIIRKKGVLFIMFFGVYLLNGCSVESTNMEDNNAIYSREYTTSICSDSHFGNGRTDDIYTVLEYVYKNEEFKEKYGDSFEVSDIGGSSDCNTFMFFQIFKGTGKYCVTINHDEWTVELSKDYFSKWNVTQHYEGWILS